MAVQKCVKIDWLAVWITRELCWFDDPSVNTAIPHISHIRTQNRCTWDDLHVFCEFFVQVLKQPLPLISPLLNRASDLGVISRHYNLR